MDTPLHHIAKQLEREEDLVRGHEEGAARALTLDLQRIPLKDRRAIYELMRSDDEAKNKHTIVKYVDQHLELTSPYSIGPVQDPIKHIGNEIKKSIKHIFGN